MDGGGCSIVRGDAVRLPFRDGSVRLIITSPPYFALRLYRDDGVEYDGQIGNEPSPQAFLESLWTVTRECWRVLHPEGSMFINLGDKRAGSGGHNNRFSGGFSTGNLGDQRLRSSTLTGGKRTLLALHRDGDQQRATHRNAPDRYEQASFGRAKTKMLLPHRYAAGCIDGRADPDGIGWLVRQDIVWHKPNGLPQAPRDRTTDSHEYVFHLAKQGQYFADLDALREPHARIGGWPKVGPSFAGHPDPRNDPATQRGHRGSVISPDPRGRRAGSVWTMATDGLRVPKYLGLEHFASFPQELPRRIILGWSRPGDVVVDPFGGTGTVAMVARALGRYGVSLDLSADYCALARWRVFESRHGAKSRARTYRELQGTLDLDGEPEQEVVTDG